MYVTGNPTTSWQEELVIASSTTFALSVGDYIKVEDEIMLTTAVDAAGNSTIFVQRAQAGTSATAHATGSTVERLDITILNQGSAVSSSEVTITVVSASAAGIMSNVFIQIESEILRVYNVTSDTTLEVKRGVADTVAVTHADGLPVYLVPATTINQVGGILNNIAGIMESIETITVTSVFSARIGVGAYLQVNEEYFFVRSISGNDVTISRCQLNSCTSVARHAHADGEPIIVVRSGTLQNAMTASDTSFLLINRNSLGVIDGAFVKVGDEIMRIVTVAISTNSVNVLKRAQARTSASVHAAGSQVTVVLITLLDNGRAISSTDVNVRVEDTTQSDSRQSFGDIFVGSLIQVDQEVMLVTNISGNDLVVERAQAGTYAAPHFDKSMVEVLRYAPLAASATALNSTLVLNTAADLPHLRSGIYLQIEREIVLVVSVAGNNVTVTRGQRGTAAAAHPSGSAVFVARGTYLEPSHVLAVDRGSSGTTAAFHQDGSVVTTVVPTSYMAGDDLFGPVLTEWFQDNGTAVLTVAGTTTLVPIGLSNSWVVVLYAAVAGAVNGTYIQIDDEIILVSGRNTNNLTITRAQALTTAAAHSSGTTVTALSMTLLTTDLSAAFPNISVDTTFNLSVVHGQFLAIGREVVRVTAVRACSFDVERAQAGTVSAFAAAGTPVTLVDHTLVASSITSTTQTSFNVDSPSAAGIEQGSYIQVGAEIMYVVSVAGVNVSVSRGEASTTPSNHTAGRPVVVVSSSSLNIGS
eukprot:139061-Rhodomonas_salina.1